MRFIKKSARSRPEVSLILLDWSVRESFHILHYLAQQTVARDRFEVIVIEYYSRLSRAIQKHADQVDTWILLEMPADIYYHKHLMYNVGIVLGRGKIIGICDSDAMVRETFIKSVLDAFNSEPTIILHLDQFRNDRRDLYPFNFPSFADVVGEGCINYSNGKTVGVSDGTDPLHTRNYGACMCALRSDLIAIGGADEHIDYLGHICGPYEMTFRLVNYGRRELWLNNEFTYHTWHPGQSGENNYVGPHDGRHLSSRALQAKFTGRTLPFAENRAIRNLRLEDYQIPLQQLLSQVVSEERLQAWSKENVAILEPRLWRTLLSCRRRVVALRLAKTFSKLLLRRVQTKAAQLITTESVVSDAPVGSRGVIQSKSSSKAFLSLARAKTFLRITVEFFVAMIHRSRDCLRSLLTQGHSEVSIYGTDDVAEILYDLTFDIPLKVKNVYGDTRGKMFHAFRVLPIDGYRPDDEPLIITGSAEVMAKIDRVRNLGVPPERMIIVI
jgi:hypothetical protein